VVPGRRVGSVLSLRVLYARAAIDKRGVSGLPVGGDVRFLAGWSQGWMVRVVHRHPHQLIEGTMGWHLCGWVAQGWMSE
jgi:hypothetical protein